MREKLPYLWALAPQKILKLRIITYKGIHKVTKYIHTFDIEMTMVGTLVDNKTKGGDSHL